MKLRCEECRCTTELARGWRAQIVDEEDDPEMDAYVVCYCPSCDSASSGSPSRGTGNKTASSPNELLRAVVARLLGRKALPLREGKRESA
jgi:hypothetical protein